MGDPAGISPELTAKLLTLDEVRPGLSSSATAAFLTTARALPR
jgi:4-hydroxy-L-threonine phosphate dehydrogenase PdxA